MKAPWIDVSSPLSESVPSWPGRPSFRRTAAEHDEGGERVVDSALVLDAHAGTHVDAPAHYLADGATVEQLDLDVLIGPALVVRLDDDVDVVTADVLDRATMPARPRRLLLATRNATSWPDGPAPVDQLVGLDESAATWCVENGLRLIGIDHLSIQSPAAGPETHRILFRAGVVVLEGLDLRAAGPGAHELVFLPLLVPGAEGAPGRALLRPLEPGR